MTDVEMAKVDTRVVVATALCRDSGRCGPNKWTRERASRFGCLKGRQLICAGGRGHSGHYQHRYQGQRDRGIDCRRHRRTKFRYPGDSSAR